MKTVKRLAAAARRAVGLLAFRSSRDYWVKRYQKGGDSGFGSYGEYARFKAGVLNEFVAQMHVQTVIEYGCGDGNQLLLARYPSYTGYDISPEAIARCRALFKDDPTKTFRLMDEYAGETADLTLSLDVLYHLVEQEVFAAYLTRLFASAKQYVIIYSTDEEGGALTGPHIRHRRFTGWVRERQPAWRLVEHTPGYAGPDGKRASKADFFIYQRIPLEAAERA